MPVDLTPDVDYRVMLFAAGLAVVTGVAFGLVPALRLTRGARLVAGRYSEAPLASLRRFGMRNVLVVAQIAMSTVLVVCSGLFLRSLRAAERIDSGMNPRNVALVQFDPSLSRYDGERAARLMQDLLSDAEALPGVRSASLANMLPLSLASSTNRVKAEGAEEGDQAAILAVGPGYFQTVGMRLLAGQDFRPGPMAEAVGIVNEELARRLYPGQDPVGRRLMNAGRTVRIIGVASNAKYRMLQETEPVASLYEPILDTYETNGASGGVTLMVRCEGDPAAMGEAIRQRMRARDADLAVNSVSTMEAHVREALFLPRLAATLFGVCGAIGLAIASIGVYGVISFAVSRRRKEIGIRMALGGQTRAVVLMVMRHGMALTVCGVALGMIGALLLARWAGGLAMGVSVSDPLTYGVAGLALAAAGVLATAVPARRAAAVDPILALRAE
jgi:predicted permease